MWSSTWPGAASTAVTAAQPRGDPGVARAVSRAWSGRRSPTRHARRAVWLQASTATIYAHRYDAPNDERTGILGGDEAGAPSTWTFSIDVARAWEAELDAAVDTANAQGGAAIGDHAQSRSRRRVRHAAGARPLRPRRAPGDGRQFISWLHYEDFIEAVRWLIAREHLAGIVNVAAPQPLPNAEFMRTLREAWGARFGLAATTWMLEIGALAMRTETELILKSRRVVSTRCSKTDSGSASPSGTRPRAICAAVAGAQRAALDVARGPAGRCVVR
jgi:NAD dependent epimerase/dehydratase family enzyme